MKKFISLILALVLLLPAVAATQDVTFTFTDKLTGNNITDVQGSVYNCANGACSQVAPFSAQGGVIHPSGQPDTNFSTTDGQVTIRWPTDLHPHNYALYFVSKGYVPLMYKADFWGTTPARTFELEFYQKETTCRAVVDELEFVNELKPYIPLVVNMSARLDARTSSAFELIPGHPIQYLPQEFLQEHWGADTLVKFEIFNSQGHKIHQQQKELTAANGNAIIASTSVPVQFKYVPTNEGDYLVKVTAQVVDDQCSSFDDSSAEGDFSVLEDEPESQFYTILNKLRVNNTHPNVGEPVLVTYNKITNYANGSQSLTAVQTDVMEEVTLNGNNVFNRARTLFANPTTTDPVTYSFTFVPQNAGVHEISVSGEANSVMQANNPEIVDEETFQLTVYEEGEFDLDIYVRDLLNGSGIPNADVTIIGIGTEQTNSNGKAEFDDVPAGEYTFKAEAANYSTKTRVMRVFDNNVIYLDLRPGDTPEARNTAPLMNLPDTLEIQADRDRSFNIFHYTFDDEDRDQDLTFSVTNGHPNISVNIKSDGTVKLTPDTGFTGTGLGITFQVNDTLNLTAQDTISVDVVSGPQSQFDPAFTAINALSLVEDTPAVRILNLRDHATDSDTPIADLDFTVTSVTPNTLATARIESGQYLSVYPEANANGNGNITVEVTDGTGNDTVDIAFDIQAVNDAPEVIAVPPLLMGPESTNVSVNLSIVFRDPDGDVLSYVIDTEPNLTFDGTNLPLLVITPDFNVNGTRQFNVTAVDPAGLNDTAHFTLDLDFVDDAPRITATIPGPGANNVLNVQEDFNNSVDLTPFESDPEDGGPNDFNSLAWKMRLANDTNGTPATTLSTAYFDAEILTNRNDLSNETLIVAPKPNMVGDVNITVFLFDSAGQNDSANFTVHIIDDENDAPEFQNLANQTAQAGQLFSYVLNATDPDTVNNVINYSIANSTLAGVTIDATSGNLSVTPNTNGAFDITVQACDNTSPNPLCTNGTFTLTVNDTLPPMFTSTVEPTNPSVYVPNATYTFQATVSDNGNITDVKLDFDGTQHNATNISSNTWEVNITDLAAGSYNYQWIAIDGANNQNSTNVSQFNVSKAPTSVALLLNSTASNITVSQGTTVNISAPNLTRTAAPVGPLNKTISILRNGTAIANGNPPLSVNSTFNNQGSYEIIASFAGDQNYSASNTSLFVNVPDTVAPVLSNQNENPSSPAAFSPLYTFTVDATDNVGVATVLLEVDGTNVTANSTGGNTYEANLTSLTVGNHTMKWYAEDAANNVGNTSSFIYEVVQGQPAITLTMNGVNGNAAAQINDTVTFVANVTNPAGANVNLYVNGTQVATGASPLTYQDNFTSASSFPVTAEFTGNANVTAGNVTHTLTITPPISVASVNPPSGTHFNFSFTAIAVDTTNQTTCSWDYNDVAQGSMANNFNTANGLNHTSTIVNMTLGNNGIHVACNNQSASSNTDLVYVVDNILDFSTLVGSNNLSNNVMTNSLINGTTLTNVNGTNNSLTNVTGTDSVVNNSVLSHCTVTNATVLDITASQCNLSDGLYDPSDLTGTTATGSTITDSTVTWSTVTNSIITDSTINNSVITNSNITNSTFSDATVMNANIANDVISTGSTSVTTPNGTITYNATANGSANLSQVVPVPPQASFTPTSKNIKKGNTVSFTDQSTDSNIGGPLNDSLTYFWDFGDGSNSTSANASHKYTSTGTFTVTLTVTDSFGLTDQATGTVTVKKKSSGGSSGGGGGGGGSSYFGSGGGFVVNSGSPSTRIVYLGQPLYFTVDGKRQPLPMVLRRTNQQDGSSQWMLNGQPLTIPADEATELDVSGDGVEDIELTVTEVTRTSATINVKASNGVARPLLDGVPFENFGEPEEEDLPEVPQVKEPTETKETTVDVEADVKEGAFTKMKNAIKNLFGSIKPGSLGVKIGIVLAVVILGLVAYAIFVRWERI